LNRTTEYRRHSRRRKRAPRCRRVSRPDKMPGKTGSFLFLFKSFKIAAIKVVRARNTRLSNAPRRPQCSRSALHRRAESGAMADHDALPVLFHKSGIQPVAGTIFLTSGNIASMTSAANHLLKFFFVWPPGRVLCVVMPVFFNESSMFRSFYQHKTNIKIFNI